LRQTLLASLPDTFSKAKAVSDLVTEDELKRARIDPAFRQQFLAENLDRLLRALKKKRAWLSTRTTTPSAKSGRAQISL